MPSAATAKLEKQASTETVDPIKQVTIIIDHKIRNLEKRKRKIESYREEKDKGKELNGDQENAVSKYTEVIQTLEFAKDLAKQFNSISVEATRLQKKQVRKELQERTQQDINKIKEVLIIQDVLQNMGPEMVRNDFLAGINGAVQLTEDDLKYLDDLYEEVSPKHKSESNVSFEEQLNQSAEHFLAIVEGKQKDFIGTTYAKLKEIVNSINSCGYFDHSSSEIVETRGEVPEEKDYDEEKKIDEQCPASNISSEQQTLLSFKADVSDPGNPIIPPASSIVVSHIPAVVTQHPIPVAVPQQPILVQPAVPPSVPHPQGNVVVQPIVVQHPPTVVPHVLPSVIQHVQQSSQPAPIPVAAVESSYFTSAQANFLSGQKLPIQTNTTISEVISSGAFNFLQESELDSSDMSTAVSEVPDNDTAPTVGSVVPEVVPAGPIPTQTFMNQNFATVAAAVAASKPKAVEVPEADQPQDNHDVQNNDWGEEQEDKAIAWNQTDDWATNSTSQLESDNQSSYVSQSNPRGGGNFRGRGSRGRGGPVNGYGGRARGNYPRGGNYGYRNSDGGNGNYYQNGFQQRGNYGGGYKPNNSRGGNMKGMDRDRGRGNYSNNARGSYNRGANKQ